MCSALAWVTQKKYAKVHQGLGQGGHSWGPVWSVCSWCLVACPFVLVMFSQLVHFIGKDNDDTWSAALESFVRRHLDNYKSTARVGICSYCKSGDHGTH